MYLLKDWKEIDRHGLENILDIHTKGVNWFVAAGIFPVSLVFQWYQMRNRQMPAALSAPALLAQEFIFSLVGISWMYRVTGSKLSRTEWYATVGYVTLDHILVSLVQSVIYVLAVTKSKRERVMTREDETSPLLVA
jgi:O-antigen/teichoic acid export membrane protein